MLLQTFLKRMDVQTETQEMDSTHPAWRQVTLVGTLAAVLAFVLGFIAEPQGAGTPDRIVYAACALGMLSLALVLMLRSQSTRTVTTLIIGGSGCFFVYRLIYLLYFAPAWVNVPTEMTEGLFWVPVVYLVGYLIPGLVVGRYLAFIVNLLLLLGSLGYLLVGSDTRILVALAQLNLANWTFAYTVRKFSIYKDLVIKAQSEREAMTQLARTDGLTGLHNRRHFETTLGVCLANARADERFAVVFIDLDRFKTVNDTHGHAVGDELLIAVAGRLRHAVRHQDVLARLSGDEFVILLKGLHSAAEAQRITQVIAQKLKEPFGLSRVTLNLSASLGVSVFPDDGSCATELLEKADQAMYHLKAQSQNDTPSQPD